LTLGALYGCIPVLIGDGWHNPLGELLPYDTFSVSVPEVDIPILDQILAEISLPQIKQMQRALECVKQRWLYSTILGARRPYIIIIPINMLMPVQDSFTHTMNYCKYKCLFKRVVSVFKRC
jgi:hypothetical protein